MHVVGQKYLPCRPTRHRVKFRGLSQFRSHQKHASLLTKLSVGPTLPEAITCSCQGTFVHVEISYFFIRISLTFPHFLDVPFSM